MGETENPLRTRSLQCAFAKTRGQFSAVPTSLVWFLCCFLVLQVRRHLYYTHCPTKRGETPASQVLLLQTQRARKLLRGKTPVPRRRVRPRWALTSSNKEP